MNSFLPFNFRQNNFLLTAGRSIFWEEEKTMILSDLHLGKAGHFRKNGIGIPQTIFKEDLQRLVSQIQYFKPKQLLVVGDLFHSTANKEHDLFLKWRNDLYSLSIQLVIGNHDILPESWYETAGIDIVKEKLQIGNFLFTHDFSLLPVPPNTYTFSGHIHPGITLTGMGRQTLKLPCFYFGNAFAVLPAFSKFTGTSAIKPLKEELVFAIVEGKVVKV